MTDPPEPIRGARLLFSLDPAVAHLNHGSFGAVPILVQRAQQRLRDEMAADPQRFFTRGLNERLGYVRRHLATALGADSDRTALVANATTGIGIALRSARPDSGQEIVTTDHGYGAVDLAVRQLCQATGATHRKVALPLTATDDEIVATVAARLHPDRTRLVIVDQVTSPTALLLPVERIVRAVRERAPHAAVAVDGAHVPGMLPVAVDRIGADFWVGNLHKWAFAPPGSALLVVSPAWVSRVVPPTVSWEQDSGFPAAVESQGTLDYTNWLAAPTGFFLLNTLDATAVRAHNVAMARWGQRLVAEALGMDPVGLPDPGAPVSMRLVPLPETVAGSPAHAQALRNRIADELATEVAVTSWNGHGLLRLSGQIYNHPDEYRRLATGLPKLLGRLR